MWIFVKWEVFLYQPRFQTQLIRARRVSKFVKNLGLWKATRLGTWANLLIRGGCIFHFQSHCFRILIALLSYFLRGDSPLFVGLSTRLSNSGIQIFITYRTMRLSISTQSASRLLINLWIFLIGTFWYGSSSRGNSWSVTFCTKNHFFNLLRFGSSSVILWGIHFYLKRPHFYILISMETWTTWCLRGHWLVSDGVSGI